MYATYHLTSAQELSADIVDAIKATFKSKPITIIVEEDEGDFECELTDEQKAILDDRVKEDRTNYLTVEESLNRISKKQGL